MDNEREDIKARLNALIEKLRAAAAINDITEISSLNAEIRGIVQNFPEFKNFIDKAASEVTNKPISSMVSDTTADKEQHIEPAPAETYFKDKTSEEIQASLAIDANLVNELAKEAAKKLNKSEKDTAYGELQRAHEEKAHQEAHRAAAKEKREQHYKEQLNEGVSIEEVAKQRKEDEKKVLARAEKRKEVDSFDSFDLGGALEMFAEEIIEAAKEATAEIKQTIEVKPSPKNEDLGNFSPKTNISPNQNKSTDRNRK